MNRDRTQSAFYQIGGYLADSQPWFGYDTPKLVDAFWQLEPGGIDLTLGIVPSGASYLLLPLHRWPALQRAHNLRTPHKTRPASAYLSLSPVHFDTPAAFKQKLNSLRPQKTKQPTDTSQANKRYAIGPKDGGAPRAAFEHSRLLLRALRAEFDVAPYGLARSPQWAGLQVLALALNRWSMGAQLLDLGWTHARPGAAQLDPQATVHIALAEGAHYGVAERRKAAFRHGETETMPAQAAAARLRDALAEIRAAPVLLLVHDEPAARAALHDLGIQTDTWASGVDALLRSGLVKHEAAHRPPYRDERSHDRRPYDARAPYRDGDRGTGRRDGHGSGYGYDYGYDYERDRGRGRSYTSSSCDDRAPARRSRSPHRDRDRDRARDRRDDYARDHSDRARGPSSRERERDGGAGAGGGVYVVDVRVLFDALTQTARTQRTIGADARDLGAREAGEGEWCAGNESRVLAELWYAMAAGEAIDEQRAARWPAGALASAAAGGGGGAGSRDATEDEDPNDVDPNDVVPARKAALTLYDDFDLYDSEEERGEAQYNP